MNARPTLRPSLCALTALMVLGFGFNASAQSVATTPVGAVTLTFPEGTTAASLTLGEPSVTTAVITSASGNTITANGANWVSGNYATLAAPYAVRINSGVLSGATFKVTSNTSTVLTLDTKGVDISLLVAAQDKFSIIPVDTLGTLFGTTAVDFFTASSAASADNIIIWSGTGWLTYFHNGTSWRRTGSLANQNDAVLMPDDGFLVVRRGAGALTLTITGAVRDSGIRTILKGQVSSFAANGYPVDQQLSTLPFANMTGWLKASSASSADNVIVWSGTSWLTFFHNGTSWRRAGSLSGQDGYVIPAGTPYFVNRLSSVADSSAFALFALPYSL